MRIGIDARLWNETGVGRYIRNLVWQLQVLDKKNDYTLFVSKKFRIEDLGFKDSRFKIVQTDIRWHTIEEQLQFPKILEKEQLDLVHFPYFSVPIRYNRPFVITIHDLIINHYPTGKASTLPSLVYYLKLQGYKFVIKQAARKARKVIAVSQATKDEIVKHLEVSQDKVVVTYEGVEIREQVGTRDKKLDYRFFLYVGNAYPHKNLNRLIEAFALVVKEHNDVKLVLVGKEDYFYKRLKEKVSDLTIAQYVLFTGFVSESELGQYYKNAIATIQPALMEGFGLTGLEAMQSNCLVLASDIPSLKEIYGDAALYFNPLAVESMRATILEVLKERKKFQPFIEKGRKRIADFSWEKMAKQTMKIYESCIGVRSNQ